MKVLQKMNVVFSTRFSTHGVIPAQAGIHDFETTMDPRFRGGDEKKNAGPAPAQAGAQR